MHSPTCTTANYAGIYNVKLRNSDTLDTKNKPEHGSTNFTTAFNNKQRKTKIVSFDTLPPIVVCDKIIEKQLKMGKHNEISYKMRTLM